MRHQRSVDKGRRMKRRKDSMLVEQDVLSERSDRTREAGTVQSSRNEVESRKRENYRKLIRKEKKNQQAWNTGAREKD